jgi:hypothetical protein
MLPPVTVLDGDGAAVKRSSSGGIVLLVRSRFFRSTREACRAFALASAAKANWV